MKAISLCALTSTAMLLTLPALAQDTQNSQPSTGQPNADIKVQQPAADVNVQQPAPQVTVEQPAPQVTVTQPKPEVTVEQPKPTVTVNQPKPDVTVEQQGKPTVQVEQPGQPEVNVQQTGEAQNATQQGTSDQATADTAAGQAQDNPLYDMTGTDIIGRTLYGANGEDIAEVDNIVIGRQGDRSPAAVVGVGGFLGLGERNIAIPLDEIQLQGDRLTTSMTRQQIADMQPYDQANWSDWTQDRRIGDAVTR